MTLIYLLTAGGTGKSTDDSTSRSLEDESDDTGLPHIFGMLLVSVLGGFQGILYETCWGSVVYFGKKFFFF